MKPPKLKTGDQVAIISPSDTIADKKEKLAQARKNFEQATGLRTVLGPNALAQNYYAAGTVRQKLDDFHWAITNPEIKAVLFGFGGKTAIDLVDKLDYELIRRNPKIIAGISDATTLLSAINAKTGLVTFYGLELLDFATEPMNYEIESIKKTWFDGEPGAIRPNPDWRNFDGLPTSYKGWRTIREGVAKGKIVGGNYGMFAQLYHTDYVPRCDGNILVMEAYQYHKRNLHQAFAQLRLWGAFDRISGLVVGYCLGSDDPATLGDDRDLADILLDATEGYSFPIMQIGEIGHKVENIMLPIGAKVQLNATNKELIIQESVTT